MSNVTSQLGRLTKDPVVRDVSGKYKVANLTIAVRGAGEKVNGAQLDGFFDVEAWGKSAELAEQYLKKGSLVSVTGSLKQSKWTTPEGDNRYSVKIVASRFDFVPGNGNEKVEDPDDSLVEDGHPDEYDPFSE